MPRTTLTVDGQTILDADLNEWNDRSPESLRPYIDPKQKKSAWGVAAMTALVDAITTQRSVHIDVQHSDRGWTLTVNTL